MQKIWVCGASGQIGTAINDMAGQFEFEIINTDMADLNITNMKEVFNFGEKNRPDIIINCAGITSVEQCEEEPREAFKVNALGARNLSIIAKKLGGKFVQISTDDVFDGRSEKPYNEFSSTNPKTIYGKSKLAGEHYVKEFINEHFIIRSTWVYGKGDNFVMDFLEKIHTRKVVSIATDHYGSPTNANELAKFILHLACTNEYGTYHATNQGICSRYDFAKEILRLTGKKGRIKAVPKEQSDFSAVRPANAALENFILSLTDIYNFPNWEQSLAEYLEEGRMIAHEGK